MDAKQGARARKRPQERDAVKQAVKQIERCPALHAKYVLLRDALTKGFVDDVADRYAVGGIVDEVKREPKKYGTGGVRLLAKVLGVAASSLYEAASVAAAFPSVRMKELQIRTNGFGVPLTFSHFVWLARVKPTAKRDALLERAYHEGLTARDLQAEIGAEPKKVATSDPEETVRRALRQFASVESSAADLLESVRALKRAGSEDALRELAPRHAALVRVFAELAPLLPAANDEAATSAPHHSGVGIWGQRRGEA